MSKKPEQQPVPTPDQPTRENPPPVLGTDEPGVSTPIGAPDGTGQDFYVGTYRSREDADKGFREKDETISRLTSERDLAMKSSQGLQRIVDGYITGPPQPTRYHEPVHPGAGYPTYAGHPAAGAPPPAASIPEITLRDPVDDPKGFAEDMKKVVATMGQYTASVASQAVLTQIASMGADRQRQQALWDYFQAVNPDLAEHAEVVGESFRTLYGGQIPQDVHGMMNTLAAHVRARVTAAPPPASTTAPPAPGRTDGIVGGGHPAAPAGPAPAPQKSSLTSEIKAMQSKSGFF